MSELWVMSGCKEIILILISQRIYIPEVRCQANTNQKENKYCAQSPSKEFNLLVNIIRSSNSNLILEGKCPTHRLYRTKKQYCPRYKNKLFTSNSEAQTRKKTEQQNGKYLQDTEINA